MSIVKASTLIKAANSYKLPAQLIECLVCSGYESIASVAAITELSTIEKFFRSTSNIFSPEEINRIYGRFASEPDQFCFLPGHQTQLQGFIEYCKRFKKENKGSVTLEKSFKRQKHQVFKSRPVKIIRTEDRVAILPETHNSHSEAGNLGEAGEDFTIIQQSDENELVLPLIQADGQPCVLPTQEQAEFLAEVFKRLQNRIKNWCMTNSFLEIQRLKFRTDFDIIISPMYSSASFEEKEKSLMLEEHFGCQAHVSCCICNRVIRLHPQRGGFCTSNLFRHFISCRTKKTKEIVDNTSMIQFLFRDSTERSAEESVDGEVVEGDVVEGDENVEQTEVDSKATITEVQEMIYVTEDLVEQESEETDSKHLVRIAVMQAGQSNEG